MEKEKNKERRERVAYVLTQKLVAKFGVNFTSVISFFVEEFFNSHEEITGSELTVLEREIRGAIKAKINSQKNTARDESDRKGTDAANQPSDPTTQVVVAFSYDFLFTSILHIFPTVERWRSNSKSTTIRQRMATYPSIPSSNGRGKG